MPKKSLFIVLEGIDGSGSSTQAGLFVPKLFASSKYNHVLLTREPYSFREIRRRLREETDSNANAELMADLFIQDRTAHIQQLIEPNLSQGVHVVSDRYKISTLAYQSAQGLDLNDLINRHQDFLVPDITFVIDVPVEVALKRLEQEKTRKPEQKFEQEDFQEKLVQQYKIAIEKLRKDGETIIEINGTPSQEQVAELVWQNFVKNFPYESNL